LPTSKDLPSSLVQLRIAVWTGVTRDTGPIPDAECASQHADNVDLCGRGRRPQNLAIAFNNRGNAYLGKRQYDRAIKDYDEAIRLDPNDDLYFGNRGDAFRITGQYERAIADYRKALSLKIDEPTKKQVRLAAPR
jgi:tetratricopeptide (TPR) repeat protein